MNKLFIIFLFTLLFQNVTAFGQGKVNKENEISYVDSAIYYFQKCRTEKKVDTLIFYKGIEFLEFIELTPDNIEQIENISTSFKGQNNHWFSSIIDEMLIYIIARSDSMDLAIGYCKNIISNYEASPDPGERMKAIIALAELRIPLRNKDILAAFEYYTARLKIYLGQNDSTAIAVSYFCLGTFYRLKGLPDMTIYNFKKSLSYINKNDKLTTAPISGLRGWINNTSVLGQLYLEIGDYPTAIAYSLEARNVRLKQVEDKNVSFLNCNIALAKIMLNQLDSVNELLNSSLQMASDNKDYPSVVRTYELKGIYFLKINQLDSAETNILKCKEAMQINNIKHFSAAGTHTPNYQLAKIRILQNRFKDARALLEEEIIEIGHIKNEVLKEQKLLIEVYNQLGDSKAADSTFKKYTELQEVIRDEDRKNRSLSFEVESKITEAENTIKDLVTEKKIADLTRKYLIGIAALLLIVATLIFNRFMATKKQKIMIEKEKKRSEELLLNILPSEVAEELKTKGSADAKHFDEVTVMFTDFKGFTQISEKLTPSELVSEIHTCFKAFDNIIDKYNIEKIKTIGDSYMCAGGLPVANKTNAIDVVRAASEIQQFMQQHLEQRRVDGKELFEIRIGIHTGPVVAGIVGVKKFAYDIWGDTVNIASRMESSSEAGKVNISGSTYELVKHNFNCLYRGKIKAKNKGEIDMYFVEAKK